MSTATHAIIGKAVLEMLERRQMMSAVSFRDGILVVQGMSTAPNDLAVNLSVDGASVWGVANGEPGQPIQTLLVRQIRIIGGDADDTIRVDPRVTIPVYVQAGNGDDDVATGIGNDTVIAGNGNDSIDSYRGNDYVEAGNGADFIHGGGGNDSIDGGAGSDVIFGDNGRDSIEAGSGSDSITGGAGSDFITASGDVDHAVGSYGNDTIVGDLDDTLTGGQGHDRVLRNSSNPLPPPIEDPVSPTAPTVIPQPSGFAILSQETGAPLAGFENVQNSANLDLGALGNQNLSIRANVPSDFTGTAIFKLDGGADISVGMTEDFTLALSNWDVAGNHTVQVHLVTPAGLAGRTLTLNVTLQQVVGVPAPVSSDPTEITAAPDAPVAAITAMETSVAQGHAVHVNAMTSDLNGSTPLTSTYDWDFGDAGSKYNQLRGYNAAHLYQQAGNYTITLTVTNPDGAKSVTTQEVTVTEAQRKVIYVSNRGSDSNSGLSPQSAIKTLDKARSLVGDNTEILLERGGTFSLSSSIVIKGQNVVIGAYGNGDRPRINWTGAADSSALFSVDPAARDVSFEDLSFDKATGGHACINAGGTNIAVTGCEFLHVFDCVNTNKKPTGVLVQDNIAPLDDGVEGFLVWIEGSDHVILGNTVANSTRAQCIRDAWADRVLVAYNDLTNLDRRPDGDQFDENRQTLSLHLGNYLYVYNNSFTAGRCEVGPLAGGDGLMKADWQVQRVNWAVVEGNTFHDSAFLSVCHGTNHMMVRQNVFNQDAGGMAITVDGYSSVYQRDVEDLTITQNTGINTGTKGTFLYVGGAVKGITLTNNLYVAPNITPGVGTASGVYVNGGSLSSFRQIDGNVWPTANPNSYAQGGVMFVGASMSSSGYRDAAEWNELTQVGQDSFQSLKIGADTSLMMDGQIVGSILPLNARVAA
jgi:PKD repeat protein